MPLIYRNAGAWGPGKGARLTSLEADGNVYDLDSRVLNLELNPPAISSRGAAASTWSSTITPATRPLPLMPRTSMVFAMRGS